MGRLMLFGLGRARGVQACCGDDCLARNGGDLSLSLRFMMIMIGASIEEMGWLGWEKEWRLLYDSDNGAVDVLSGWQGGVLEWNH